MEASVGKGLRPGFESGIFWKEIRRDRARQHAAMWSAAIYTTVC
jgi:hypothetical protein